MPLIETITAVGGLVTGLVTGIGGMWVRARRARVDDRQAATDADRLSIDARDGHLNRLEREILRLGSALDDARDDHEACLRLHRECSADAARLGARVAHLEERVGQVEQRSGDSTPTSPERV
jgi:chromosome segregation ATPase